MLHFFKAQFPNTRRREGKVMVMYFIPLHLSPVIYIKTKNLKLVKKKQNQMENQRATHVIMFNEVPFLEDLRVGFHQVIRDVVTCQILEDVSSQPFNLKDEPDIDTHSSIFHHMIPRTSKHLMKMIQGYRKY